MGNFSYQQKIAMMRILLDIINADGRIDARERFMFNYLKEQFKLSDIDIDTVKSKLSLLALTQVKYFTSEQKQYFAVLMRDMVCVDHDINANEVEVYDLVCDVCGIDSKFWEAIKDCDTKDMTLSGDEMSLS